MTLHILSRRALALVAVTLLGSALSAQQADTLTLDRLFASRDFAGERFGPARWLSGGGYTTLEPSDSADGGSDIVRYDPATGTRKILVSAKRLVPAGRSQALEIEDYNWSPDGKRLLVYTNSQRVWRQNTRGDYWVLDLATGALRQLGGSAPASTLMFAKFSPDGGRVGYVRQSNLYVEDVVSGRITQLTTDGSRTTINGTFDWVYEEELDDRDGWRWSPDGAKIAYWQLDASGVRDFLLIDDTDSLYSFTKPVQYPKAGTTNSAARVGVVAAAGGATTWLKVPGDPRNNYIARLDWAASSSEVVVQHLNRLQNTLELMLGDATTGAVKAILTDRDSAWTEIVDDLVWLDGGKRFTWVSERDGWRRVYAVSRDGATIQPISPAGVDALSVTIDEKGGWLYYIASPDDAGQRYLWRISLSGKAGEQPQRLTPMNEPGWHSYDISPDSRYAFHTWSRFDEPYTIDLIALPKHAVVRTMVDNAALRKNVAALGLPPVEFFRVDVGHGVTLDGWMIKPKTFDPAKKWPVLFNVYGEPAGQTVTDRWGGNFALWHRYLAQLGYVVMSVDNRGTPAPRGRAWRKIVYKKIGVIASQDQAGALTALLHTNPWMDSTRIGIWGWSGGGSMTLNMILRYPDLYATGMAVAPVPDIHYYDTIYQERYMGLPQDDSAAWAQSSPITFAKNLKGHLLVMHGSGDDNVHYQGTESLVNRFIENGKQFDLMVYPNRSHGIFEGRGTTRHVFGTLTRYLTEHLPAGAR